jgi:hypothetical protein
METWWEDPQGVVTGRYWKTPNGWVQPSPLYGMFRENPYGIVELQQEVWSPFGGTTIQSTPWWWTESIRMSYHIYVRGWARLWVWTGTGWGQVTWRMNPTIATTDAPGWCWYP